MTSFEVGICTGIVWAAILVVWTLADITTGEPSQLLLLISLIYDGYDFTPKGLLVGALWAFVDGFYSGYIISWIVFRLV
ncbi:hypothetical protein HYY75_05460 [bacterium]|nr:hypothetical protein [bacterium]